MEDKSGPTPIRPFYMPAVRDVLERCDRQEIEELLRGAREVRSQYGGFDKLIAALEDAKSRAS